MSHYRKPIWRIDWFFWTCSLMRPMFMYEEKHTARCDNRKRYGNANQYPVHETVVHVEEW